MADKSKIEWTDATWNPIRARNRETGGVGHFCVHVSPGCQFCYAEKLQPRFRNPIRYAAQDREKVGIFLDETSLRKPLRWRTPRMIFAGSMTDLFGDWVTDDLLDRIFAVMALCPQHIFQVLTKRLERAREYFKTWAMDGSRPDHITDLALDIANSFGRGFQGDGGLCSRPLPNVWLGVSVEDQQRADERIPLLLDTPAALRWVSAEPLLGPVDFNLTHGPSPLLGYWCAQCEAAILDRACPVCGREGWSRDRLDWIIVGGESGPHARPFNIEWARSTIAQCKAAQVPVFVKQLGRYPVEPGIGTVILNGGKTHLQNTVLHHFTDKKGGNPAEWPEDLRVREMPEVAG